MRHLVIWSCLIFLPVSQPGIASAQDESRQRWLEEEVAYIISDEETGLFSSLSDEEERERFIEAFWRLRDPTPGTEANEFREEHYRRIGHANSTLAEKGIPGWRTEMGRIFVLLGEPMEQRLFSSPELTATVAAWLYPPDKFCGIKYRFYVVFFKRSAKGEYSIYRPNAHGPKALLSSAAAGRGKSDVTALDRLLRIDPLLGQLALSLLPEEHGPLMLGNSAEIRRALSRRTKASEQVLDAVMDSRNRRQSRLAAGLREMLSGAEKPEKAAEYKNFSFTGAYQFHVLRNDAGKPALYFVFDVDSSMISMSVYPGRCYALLHVLVQARDEFGNVAGEKEEYVTACFSSGEIDGSESVALSHEGYLDLPAGDYRVTLTVRNPIDNRCFIVEDKVSIPPLRHSTISFYTPMVLRGAPNADTEETSREQPYLFHGVAYHPDAARVVSRGEDALILYQLYFPRRDRVSSVAVRYSIKSGGRVFWRDGETLHRESLRPGGVFIRTIRIPTARLPVGAYTLTLRAASLSPPEAIAEIDFSIVPNSERGSVPKLARVTR